MSAAASIATLIWHDSEPNMLERAISRAYGKPDFLFRVKFCYILRVYLGKKSVMYVQNMFKICSPERIDYSNEWINKINMRNLFEIVPRSLLLNHIFSE